MLSWFKKTAPPPPLNPANPGIGRSATMAFTDGTRSWSERVDVVESLSGVLSRLGHSARVLKDWIVLDNGLTLLPRLVSGELLEDSGVQTVSTIQVSHPEIVPEGVFEYQHAAHDRMVDGFVAGFEGFVETDLPVFLDALRESPSVCTYLVITSPADGATASRRRVVLGPPAWYSAIPVKEIPEDDEHRFCHCCLLTRTAGAFKEFLEGSSSFGIRLYAMRDESGEVGADCRVNGEDFEAGKRALVEYGRTWPDRGVEWRKQYVLVHSLAAAREGQSSMPIADS